jgi:AraC-like DNA-binding protein
MVGMHGLVLVRSGVLRLDSVTCPAVSLVLLPPAMSGIAPARAAPPGAALPGTALPAGAPGPEPRIVRFGRSLVDPLDLDESADLVMDLMGSARPVSARLSPGEAAEAEALFLALEREDRTQALGAGDMIRLRLLELAILLVRARHEAVPARPDSPGTSVAPLRFHAAEATGYIEEHCADALTLDGLAARYAMNPSYFSRRFHDECGMSVVECINAARIRKSCLLLKRTEASVLEIAFAVGYNNLSHFNRYFRRLMGMSPRDYRKPGGT